MKIILALSALSILSAQKIIQKFSENSGQIHYTEQIALPKQPNGYTAFLPKGDAVGLIVFFHHKADTTNNTFAKYANQKQIAVMYASTENRFDFLFDDEKMHELEGYIKTVINDYNIPQKNLLFTGMSLEGTRAARMAMFAQNEQSKYKLIPRAIAMCDSPLDFVRFYQEAIRTIDLNFSPVAVNEAQWVSGYVSKKLGGSLDQKFKAYQNYSPYSYTAKQGGNAHYFKNIAVRAYTEPDVNWWIENRRKGYYQMNAIDFAALINQLRIFGNEEAELITTQNKGYRPDGKRHPHSWSIVDETEMIDWFATLIK